MQTEFTSYLTNHDLTPPTDPREPRLVCKFVCLRREDLLHLIVGPVAEYPYHADLVERFADENEIPSTREGHKDYVELLDPLWFIKGGGWLGIDRRSSRIEFSGSSTAYGRYEAEDVELVTSTHPFFNTYQVSFRFRD